MDGAKVREASMGCRRDIGCISLRSVLAALCLFAAAAACRGDSVIMKSVIVYRSLGPPDRDNTLVYIWDGVKRVKVRDSRIERVEANNAFRGGETFKL
jgi:hypothetical protein